MQDAQRAAESESRLTDEQKAVVLGHYDRAAPLIVASFAGVPVVAAEYIDGVGGPAVFTASWHKPLPPSIPHIDIGPPPAAKRYVAVAVNSLLWLVHRNAVGFGSWTPTPRDPERVGFARILLSRRNGATPEQLHEAMLALRSALSSSGAESIPVLDGVDGAALFIPFQDAPAYDAVRTWLHAVVASAVAAHPTLLTEEPHAAKALIHISVTTNAVGRFSTLPYCIQGTATLPMVTPIEWNELGTFTNGAVTAANSAERLAKADVFAREAQAHAAQRFADISG